MANLLLPRLDTRSVLAGAGVTVAVAVPPAVIAKLMTDADGLDGSNWVVVPFAFLVAAFGIGGWYAARRQSHAPLAHGAAAAVLGWAAVQVVGTILRMLRDDPVNVGGLVFAAVLSASLGMIGGLIAHRRRLRQHRDAARAAA